MTNISACSYGLLRRSLHLLLAMTDYYQNSSTFHLLLSSTFFMFSFSQLKKYESCPKQYEFSYLHDFEDEEINSHPLLVGNIAHETLRYLYHRVSLFSLPSQDEVLHFLMQRREEQLPKNNFLDLEDSTVKDAFDQLQLSISHFYNTHLPFDSENIIGLEQRLFAKLGEHTFSATMDKITMQGDTFIITDYKTNKHLTPETLASHQEQMLLYAYVLQQNYAKYFKHIEIRLEYLFLQKTESQLLTALDFSPFIPSFTALADTIEEKTSLFKEFNDESIFPTKKAEHCRRCSFMEICPAFSQLTEEISSSALNVESIQQIIRSYVKDYDAIKALTSKKEAMKETLTAFFSSHEYQRIFGKEYQITYGETDNRKILDPEKLAVVLKEKGLWESSLSLDKAKLRKLAKEENLPSDLVAEKESYTVMLKKK